MLAMNDAGIKQIDARELKRTLKEMGDDTPTLFLDVSRQQIESKNHASLVGRLYAIAADDAWKKLQNRVHLSVSGYDRDARELNEIPEVVEFFRRVADKWDSWLHFLDVGQDSLGVFIRLMLDMDRVVQAGGRTAMCLRDPGQVDTVIEYLWRGFHRYCVLRNIEGEECVSLMQRYEKAIDQCLQ